MPAPAPGPTTPTGRSSPPPDAPAFAVEEVLGRCGRCAEPLGPSDPENPHFRWSAGEGPFLPRICPRCRQSYDPGNPETFNPADARRRSAPWPMPPREVLLVAAAAGWLVTGRLVVWSVSSGAPGGGRVGGSAGAASAVLFAVFLFLPWVFTAVLLGLLALQDRVEALPPKLLAGVALGLLACLGLPPAAWLTGLILGPLAALVLRWRELSGGTA